MWTAGGPDTFTNYTIVNHVIICLRNFPSYSLAASFVFPRFLQLRNKLNQEQNAKLQQQRECLNRRNSEVAVMDKRVNELRDRLWKKKAALQQKENLPVRGPSVVAGRGPGASPAAAAAPRNHGPVPCAEQRRRARRLGRQPTVLSPAAAAATRAALLFFVIRADGSSSCAVSCRLQS